MASIKDTVQVSCNIDYAFKYITDIANVPILFEYISNVQKLANDDPSVPLKYRQTRLVHGYAWQETVDIQAINAPTRYVLSMSIFGVGAIYDYSLETVSTDLTLVRLTKKVNGSGWKILLQPLVQHILTRPEHDGKHLQVLKSALKQAWAKSQDYA